MFILKNGGLCPVCEKGKLKEIKKDLIFKYKNRSKKFENETVFKCNLCSYEILSQEVNKRIEKGLTDFRRGINGLLLSDQLKAIRESLSLKKNEMAKLLSVNEKTVGRYENGKITQSEQIDKLYRFLQIYPSAGTKILRGAFNFTFGTLFPADTLGQGLKIDFRERNVISTGSYVTGFTFIPQGLIYEVSTGSTATTIATASASITSPFPFHETERRDLAEAVNA
jgi:putative zinc finger/helix-turn-helix YgiT family protein